MRWIHAFPKKKKTLTVLFRIWTRTADSISYNENRFAKCAFVIPRLSKIKWKELLKPTVDWMKNVRITFVFVWVFFLVFCFVYICLLVCFICFNCFLFCFFLLLLLGIWWGVVFVNSYRMKDEQNTYEDQIVACWRFTLLLGFNI